MVTLIDPVQLLVSFETAIIVILVAVSSSPITRIPSLEIVVFDEFLPLILQVTAWDGLLFPFTTAVIFAVFPGSRVMASDVTTSSV